MKPKELITSRLREDQCISAICSKRAEAYIHGVSCVGSEDHTPARALLFDILSLEMKWEKM